jgi:hypothetical protein
MTQQQQKKSFLKYPLSGPSLYILIPISHEFDRFCHPQGLGAPLRQVQPPGIVPDVGTGCGASEDNVALAAVLHMA